MIKNFTLFIIAAVFIFSINNVAAQPDQWVQKKSLYNLVAGRNYAVGFSINGKGYTGTGFSYGFGYKGGWNNDLWQYDTLTNSWTQMASMPVAGRQSATAFVINGKAYIACGFRADENALNDLWQYNPQQNKWTEKASLPNSGLDGPLSFVLNNKAYVGFGFAAGRYQRGIWQYNASADSWTRKNDFPATTIWESFALSDGNNGYAGLGYDSVNFKYVNDIWQYDAASDVWIQKNDFTGRSRFNEASFVVNNRLFIVGGENGRTYSFINDCWVYDKAADKWFSTTSFTGPSRGDAVSFSIGDNGYIGTGYDAESSGKELGDFWEFNTKKLQWRQRADLGGGPRDLAVSFNAGPVGIVATGEDGTRFKKDVWAYIPAKDDWKRLTDLPYGKNAATGFSIGTKIYVGLGLVDSSHAIINPVTKSKDFWAYNSLNQTWTQVADFGGGNRGAAISFVVNNKAYTGTGFADNGVLTNDLWQYDPASNIWKQEASLPGKKRSYATAFVINGKGYVGMGNSAQNNLTDFYEYDPSTNTWLAKANFPAKARNYSTGVASGNYGYAGLGAENNNTFLNDWWQFDPVANTWVQKTNFPNARWGASAVNIGNHIYVGMGVPYTGAIDTMFAINDWWEYLPATNNSITNIAVYPKAEINANPFSTSFTLRIISTKQEAFNVMITDENGKPMEQRKVQANETNSFGSSLPRGVFLVHISNNAIQLPVQKVIKE